MISPITAIFIEISGCVSCADVGSSVFELLESFVGDFFIFYINNMIKNITNKIKKNFFKPKGFFSVYFIYLSPLNLFSYIRYHKM